LFECFARLLAAGVPSWAIARAGIDLASGIPGPAVIGQAAGHCEIAWFGHLAICGAARLPPIAASEHAPVLGEHRSGDRDEKYYCGTKRFDFGHLSFSCLH
jgi:hypothetical protein